MKRKKKSQTMNNSIYNFLTFLVSSIMKWMKILSLKLFSCFVIFYHLLVEYFFHGRLITRAIFRCDRIAWKRWNRRHYEFSGRILCLALDTVKNNWVSDEKYKNKKYKVSLNVTWVAIIPGFYGLSQQKFHFTEALVNLFYFFYLFFMIKIMKFYFFHT